MGFANPADAQRACDEMHDQEIDGRRIKCDMQSEGGKGGGKGGDRGGGGGGGGFGYGKIRRARTLRSMTSGGQIVAREAHMTTT